MAYLNNTETSAFPEEQEYLIGYNGWYVRAIDSVTKTYKGRKKEVTVIELENSR